MLAQLKLSSLASEIQKKKTFLSSLLSFKTNCPIFIIMMYNPSMIHNKNNPIVTRYSVTVFCIL